MQSKLSTKGLYRVLENTRSSTDGNGKKTIPLNNNILTGSMEMVLLEAGLYMLSINADLKKDCVIVDNDDPKLERKYFLFSYLLSPPINDITNVTEEAKAILEPCLLTSYSNCGLKLLVKQNSTIKATILIFSDVWMETQLFSERNEMETNLFELFIRSKISILTKPEILLLKNIDEKMSGKNLLKTKIYVFNLILNSLENRNFHKKRTYVSKQINDDTLREVEKKIIDHLYTTMPSIDDMAKEFFMSASTLKRQFKRVFGSNVYEYYLSRKMQLAKSILESKHAKVSEVAAQLHYENVSHFIKIFKKIHGFQPGKISRSKETGVVPLFNDY